MKIRVGIAVAASALALAACSSSGGDDKQTTSAAAPSTSATSMSESSSPASSAASTASAEDAAYCAKLSKWDDTLAALQGKVMSGDAAGLKALVPQLSAYVTQLSAGVPAELKQPIAQVKAASDQLVTDAKSGKLDPSQLGAKFAAVVPAFTAVGNWKTDHCGS